MSQAPFVYAHIPVCACVAATVLLSIASIRPGEQTLNSWNAGTSPSPSFIERYSIITRPRGILDLLSSELEVGITLSMHCWSDMMDQHLQRES